MSIIGKPGEIYKPDIQINGEPISTLAIESQVGQISRCSIGIRPEAVAASKAGGKVIIAGEEVDIFTGVGWGPRGNANRDLLDFGFTLIHPAIGIDQGRAWAPGLHPLSTDHYTFTMGGGGSDVADSSLFGDNRLISFSIGEALTKAIPKYITNAMERAQNQRVSSNLESIGLEGNVGNKNVEAIKLLSEIVPLTASTIVAEEFTISIRIAADRFAQKLCQNSITSGKSAWDLMAMMFSAFGMTMICLPDGTIGACPDFSGCTPPKSNRISGDVISQWQGSSQYTRSPSGVVVISHGFSRGESGVSTSGQNARQLHANVGEYYPETPSPNSGGMFITGLPAWMMPSQQGGIPDLPRDLVNNYAKQIWAEVANMGRTFTVTTPLNPSAIPGTTYYFEPISTAKNLTNGGEVELPFSQEYAGYCYRITHQCQPDGGQFLTSYHFRNVFEPEEYDTMLPESAFFGEKPFEIK